MVEGYKYASRSSPSFSELAYLAIALKFIPPLFRQSYQAQLDFGLQVGMLLTIIIRTKRIII